jgi:hypothetical protein
MVNWMVEKLVDCSVHQMVARLVPHLVPQKVVLLEQWVGWWVDLSVPSTVAQMAHP